ncbi:MAG: SufE family protein [Anaerolineales bacterium]|uniref:SufE family protein n=1 Tax=Candidatus Villigracilis vicinus TaxID=3140679 RepID=UPI00313607B3|nr:SufE family protein [Anaerolineales bacterium]MBK9780960.1 SufE family protein [Anaerolineales bacterium]
MTLPNKLQEIVDDIASMSREEKLETLIAYAESMPDLPVRFQEERSKMEAVPECMTPVFIIAEKDDNSGIIFHLDIPKQSPTVRGLASILTNGLNGCSLEEIISVPADFYLPMNLQEAVSQQRINGFMGVLAHMKQVAVKVSSE